jgi:hypothetical protein
VRRCSCRVTAVALGGSSVGGERERERAVRGELFPVVEAPF